MKLTFGNILHLILIGLQILPAFIPMTPDQHLALSTGLGGLQGILGAVQHKSNPDGTSASLPYSKDNN